MARKIKQDIRETEDARFANRSPEDAVELIKRHIVDEDREVFFIVCLSEKNEVIAVHRAHIGSINASINNVITVMIFPLLPKHTA